MIWIVIILLIATLICVILAIECEDKLGRACSVSFVVILTCISMVLLYEDITINAIEVYRGNTELEITYKNNIPIDTVVVWKEQ